MVRTHGPALRRGRGALRGPRYHWVMRVAAACLVAVSFSAVHTASAGTVEYGLGYLAVPGEVDYVAKNLTSGGAQEQRSDPLSLGTFGVTLDLTLPGSVGPFLASVGTGIGLPAGSESFDHRHLAPNAPTTAPHNAKHDGDYTTWQVQVLPLLLKLRYAASTAGVSLGGEAGIGAMLLAVDTEQTLTEYDPSDTTVQSRETSRWESLALPFAAELEGGIVVPATESMDLKLFGGLVWLTDVAYTTTDSLASPSLVYGATKELPGLRLGGLGFAVRLGLSLTL